MEYIGWPGPEAEIALTSAGYRIVASEFTGSPCPAGKEYESRVVRQRLVGANQVELVLVWKIGRPPRKEVDNYGSSYYGGMPGLRCMRR